MKKIYAIVLLAFSFIQGNSQTASAVVFSEAGEKFTFFLNGEPQNAKPQSNVKINGLTAEFYQARVDFEDSKLIDIANNNFAVQKGVEATYMIKKNKKGEYVLRFQSQAEMSGSTAAATPTATQETKRIADVDDEPASGSVKMNSNVSGSGDSGNTTVTQTTTTTSKAKPTTNGENVSIGMNVNGLNMGMNVNIQDDADMDMDSEETVVTTTTTSRTTTSSSSSVNTTGTPVAEAKPVSTGRCSSSMTDASFNSAKSNISSKSFEDSKMTVAKQVTKANCLTVAQIAQVMALFSFEESKLDYAKYAYDFCYNQGDYYQVNDAFTFESSIDELNKYLESK